MRSFLLILLAAILSWRFLPMIFRRRDGEVGHQDESSDALRGEKIQDADFEELDDPDRDRS